MALPTGLLPLFVFLVTVGVSSVATSVATLRARDDAKSFPTALREGIAAAAGTYLGGISVVWAVTGGPLWGTPAALLAVGFVAAAVVVALPLSIGRRVVAAATDADPDRALRDATSGWPVAMVVVFGVFVAPGGVAGGHLFDLDGPHVCLVGFCGIDVFLLEGVVIAAVVGLVAPGAIGSAIHAGTAHSDSTRSLATVG